MKPSLEELRSLCPEVPKERIAQHMDRLGESYFQAFSPAAVAAHLRGLTHLSAKEPCQILFEARGDREMSCTILAFDYPSEFSLITGTLAGSGFSILAGQVFTYSRSPGKVSQRRCIIDQFVGTLEQGSDLEAWKVSFGERLLDLLRLMEEGGDQSIAEAKNRVNEAVADRLALYTPGDTPVLYPVDIQVRNDELSYTCLRVLSQDTPAFLYALSNALSLRKISIERVHIRTVEGRVEDEIHVQDRRGVPIRDEERLDQLKFSVLLVKQFTYFLGKAPDPYAALSRFERLCQDILEVPDKAAWLKIFSEPESLQVLARILGISDFIWEDFVRTQYEELLPLLGTQGRGKRPSFSVEALEERMAAAMAGARDAKEKREALNRWKDHESFSIDLDHIVYAGANVRALAEPLCRLAELVVRKAMSTVFQELSKRYGVPRTVAGLEAQVAAFGLGKFGGSGMGYASDIELLFVYSDNGRTDGEEVIPNSEFFERLAEGISQFIQAKREGIFQVDLRLRPHGNSGPKASSLTSFCQYYGPGGQAQSFEHLALTRLRHVAGDSDLGRQVERLRDEFVYETARLDLEEFQRLRERQFEEKGKGPGYNVKFSPGALVDLEYSVQILQIRHGKTHTELRTPRIHEALVSLCQVGILAEDEANELIEAYDFFRHLINSLRMLRGNALDLDLPAANAMEFVHLARRMGYGRDRSLDPGQQLYLDFETRSAVIRAFIERHFGREALPAESFGNVVDLLLSEQPSEALRERVLVKVGFRETKRALLNLRRLSGKEGQAEAFHRLAVLACDHLARGADPDMALNNWERFVSALPDAMAHFKELLSQPKRLEILMDIFSSSQFLADTLFRYPEFMDWVTDAGILHGVRDAPCLQKELMEEGPAGKDREWLNWLRRFRRRELVRIGTRDLCLHLPLERITQDLSALAEAVLRSVVEREWGDADGWERYCILALGKLGGEELNYSSDIDLMVLFQETGLRQGDREEVLRRFGAVTESVRKDLSSHTEEGYLYRVDFRLRPHGASGDLLVPLSSFERYYAKGAPLWEVQSLLKARCVAGSKQLGERALRVVRGVLCSSRSPKRVIEAVREMRERSVAQLPSSVKRNVKTGLGGIRDVEFLVQGLQLMHLSQFPDLLCGNTLRALRLLRSHGLMKEETSNQLAEDYIFMRRVEHCLQILADRQIHEVPEEEEEMRHLARRVLGRDASLLVFQSQLREVQERIRAAYDAALR